MQTPTHEVMLPQQILEKAVKGDPESITCIVKQYTPLVQKIVNKYAWMSPNHSRDDLVQEGLIGVVRAIETFDLNKGNAFMSWVYPQVRGAVQGCARKELRHPRFKLSLEDQGGEVSLSSETVYEIKDEFQRTSIKDIVENCCGSVDSKRAQIVCSRYGLLGKEPLRQGEVAEKFGMTKQAINSHISRFVKIAREKYPELRELIS